MSSASALVTRSFTGLGAPSTRSLASLRPSPVSSRTTLMTWIFFSPAAPRMTSNSVFSSAAAAPAAAPPAAPGAAATAIGAAAAPPHFACRSLESCAASSRVSLSSCSAICSTVAIEISFGLRYPLAGREPRSTREPTTPLARSRLRRLGRLRAGLRGRRGAALLQDVRELAMRRRDEPHQACQAALDRADELRPERLPRRQVGEGLELGGGQHLPLDIACLDRKGLVGPREGVQRLGDRDRIVLREDDRRRALEVCAEPFERGRLDREPRQPVLDHLVLRRHRAQLLAQLAELLDGEAAILREHHGLHGVEPRLQLLALRDLLLRRHP